MAECNEHSTSYADADHDQVSSCGVVGVVAAAPFRSDEIDEGTGWYCSRFAGPSFASACRRSKSDCTALEKNEKVTGHCAQQVTAYAVTGTPRGVFVFATLKDCEDSLDDISGPRLSSCTAVK
jgi:hypothetical protein